MSARGAGEPSSAGSALGATSSQASQSSISASDLAALERPAALPRALGARLAARVAELDARRRPALMHEIDDAREVRHEGIVPDAEIAEGAAAAPLDLGRLDDDEAGAAGGEFPRVHQMPVGRKSLHRGILVHRRDHHAKFLSVSSRMLKRCGTERLGREFSFFLYA